ncbi:MAG: single-stranded-DNA-specific exonuclease RecJ, partial [Bacteroidota bacterium]|nr:single-stranded-DNA-specific exonuclease RecJ [Bacteroidota bacterium]
MNYEWIINKQSNKNLIRKLSEELNNLNFSLVDLLIQSGIDSFDKAKTFFSPNLNELHDPFLMKDMQKAVNRLENALENNEKVLIYGDYDVDGTTSVSLVYTFLQEYIKNIDYYVPDRYNEGYGISTKAIDFASEKEISLVIALDCGIKAVDKIEYANSKNIDFIICDHHTPGEKIPSCSAVLDAKQKDCNYPYKELSGCGVGFKFMQAFAKSKNIDQQKTYELLDYVAISIASDIVPITGENRILEYFGLQKIKETKKAGLIALCEIGGLRKPENEKIEIDLTVSDLVFKIGPRINAAGRMTHASGAVDLLIEKDIEKAREFANKLNEQNTERREQQDNIFNEALEIIEQNLEMQNKKATVVWNSNWSKGIVGIVASKLTEKYYKPTIVLTKSNDKWTGSGRSVGNYDLYSAILSCDNLLSNFGGHKFAAGLTVEEENLEKFAQCFEKKVQETIPDSDLTPKLVITDILKFSDINDKFIRILKRFAPFGPENMRPVFVSFGVVDTGQSRQIGKDLDHLKLELKDGSGKIISGIAFGYGHLFDTIKNKKPFDICYTIGENVFG